LPQTASSGIRINYDDLGKGKPALVFLLGWCANRSVFRDLAPACAVQRRVLALDWRGHGESGAAASDFGDDALTQDALAVIKASEAQQVVPVALAHSGWVAIKLRQRLAEQISRVVLLEWLILDAPRPFLEALEGMQSPNRWRQTVEQIFDSWVHGVDNPKLVHFVRQEMGAYGFEMWARAAREISAAYAHWGSPLRALSSLDPPVQVLHLYAQPEDPGFLAAQQSFAASHPWFRVRKLAQASSHFPMFEMPQEIASAIEEFVA